MFRALFRFLFFVVGSILFFIVVQVVEPSLINYLKAAFVGLVCGLILFIIYTILFPIKKKNRFNDKIDTNNSNFQERNRLNQEKASVDKKDRKERKFQDTDRIYFD